MNPDRCRLTHLQSKGQWLTPATSVYAFHSLDTPAGENGTTFLKFRPRDRNGTHMALQKRKASRATWWGLGLCVSGEMLEQESHSRLGVRLTSEASWPWDRECETLLTYSWIIYSCLPPRRWRPSRLNSWSVAIADSHYYFPGQRCWRFVSY